MASASESIKLIIRATNHKYPDFNLELSPSLTVYELKQNIALNHPAKPVPKDQRLIFSGKLLDDASVINQIFIKPSSGSSFMVHLVLDSDKNATAPKIPQPKTVQTPPIVNEQPPIPETPMQTSTRSNAYEQYLEELNKYQEQLQQFLINPIGNAPVCNIETQAYLQYCYTHYQMYQNLLAYQRTVISPSLPIPTNIPNVSQQTSTNDTNGTIPPPPPAAAAQQQNNNNNDGEQENDLLGVLNMLVELFVLCSIIYFYSTFSRFLVVFFIFALLYLHCRGYLSLHRRRRAQPAPAPVAPEQPAAAAAAVNEGEQGGDEENEPEAAANEPLNQNNAERQRAPQPPAAGPVEENQITTSRLLLTAVSTFFSSLIPERPQRT